MSSQRSIPTADRISDLPDSVLCHILSFLPTKLAAATSVLSKRWKPVWLSVLALDFDDQTFIDFFSFRHFVSSVFLSRDITLPIQSFRLKCGNSSPFDPHDVNRFVCAAVQRGIQDLNLDMSYIRPDILKKLAPSLLSVLSCKTLVVLKLKNLSMSDVPQVDLPVLKTLHLHRIYFLCDYGHLKKLLYGCPILENLQTNHLMLMRMGYKSEGMFEGLTKLVRANISNSAQNVPFACVHNAKFLRAELKRTYEYQVPTFHNLTNMELIFESKIWLGKWKLVIELLEHCPKLQNLIIDEASKNVQVLEDEVWKDPETVPDCLSSQLRTCSLRDYKGFKCELQFAEYIMKNSKLLCTMTIESTCSVDGNAKHQMLVKLSSCPRGSDTCRLLFG